MWETDGENVCVCACVCVGVCVCVVCMCEKVCVLCACVTDILKPTIMGAEHIQKKKTKNQTMSIFFPFIWIPEYVSKRMFSSFDSIKEKMKNEIQCFSLAECRAFLAQAEFRYFLAEYRDFGVQQRYRMHTLKNRN